MDVGDDELGRMRREDDGDVVGKLFDELLVVAASR